MGKYVVKKSENGASFNLVARNGEVIGVSEFYSSEDACLNGIESVRKNAIEAGIEDQTVAEFEVLKHPKFEIFKDKREEFRFRLKARNGEIILASEGYTAKASCKNGIDSVVRNADSPVVYKE
ncbi:MAG TPA: YegP family protein [Erysipelotrichaceae bacterium]|nr:YegP family protein [Erysipelotrichaceae bacterium]HQB32455.1 YegP family protein [Erysipelotrichaceae bacterium]